ncbi:hypothetical protein SKAU_G00123150 [Synaphobranchus kaupii]|uniref:Uncharacterized protein n=1 Tax=Synaphobranchus kaupii TaxID=118154 RepID=A0A9Q1J1M8_SYNKA|nr:hypothetical protein SKAU_G00123150 [Synaphobranchus kaupii]
MGVLMERAEGRADAQGNEGSPDSITGQTWVPRPGPGAASKRALCLHTCEPPSAMGLLKDPRPSGASLAEPVIYSANYSRLRTAIPLEGVGRRGLQSAHGPFLPNLPFCVIIQEDGWPEGLQGQWKPVSFIIWRNEDSSGARRRDPRTRQQGRPSSRSGVKRMRRAATGAARRERRKQRHLPAVY